MARTIEDVRSDIGKLQTLWNTATQQYEARKASLAAEIDDYVAHHQSIIGNHAVEIDAANKLKASLVPAVAEAEVAALEIKTFLLTKPWYRRLVANVSCNWRWYVYGVGLVGLGYAALHIHK